jgi:hypothetical protein
VLLTKTKFKVQFNISILFIHSNHMLTRRKSKETHIQSNTAFLVFNFEVYFILHQSRIGARRQSLFAPIEFSVLVDSTHVLL